MIPEEISRRERLTALREKGIDPYPSSAQRTHLIDEVLIRFDDLEASQEPITICGRVRTIRKHGGVSFIVLEDGSGQMQAVLHRDAIGPAEYTFFHDHADVADFFEFSGPVFRTKKGERSINIKKLSLLTKTILPLPEKWHGLSDTEIRFRKRYLDLIMNKEVRNRMLTRTKIISAIREFLNARDFIEVETPTLQPIYGGGFARPFKTHHYALDADFYLRISDEMYLKRLLVGGFEKVYEITKVFRNEGIDRDHNPEFTMFEAQIAYQNYEFGMNLFEEIFEYVAREVLGTTEVTNGAITIDLKSPWKRMRLIDAVESIGGVDQLVWSYLKIAKKIIKPLIKESKRDELDAIQTIGEAMAFSFEELVERKLVQPILIYDYPVEVSPLAKKASDPRFTERFEAFVLGVEIGNNYSELNDPIDLEQRFIEEKKRKEAGFEEAHEPDYDYLEAIKHGMPPSCGLGVGVDRMVMLMTGARNIKEVILFPTLKPKSEKEKGEEGI